MIQFPFWLLTPIDPKAHPIESRLPLSFSSVDRMSKYLKGKIKGEWEVQLVNRYSVLDVIAQLTARGIVAVCHDPHDDGSGGIEIPLGEILSEC